MTKTVLSHLFLLGTFLFILSCGKSKNTENKSSVTSSEDQIGSAKVDIHKNGRKVYDIYCKICHGEDGQQELTGTYNLVTSTMTLDQIIMVTKEGRSTMMAYDAILSNIDMVDLSRYVLSMQESDNQ